MGGRGKANAGALGAQPVMGPNGAATDLNQIVKHLGFKNLQDAQKAADYKRAIEGEFTKAGMDTTAGEGQKLFNDLMNGKLPTARLKKLVHDNPKLAHAIVIHHIAHFGTRHGTLGPIMLRFGLPRNKLLDIVNALKPLRDHALLNLSMPFSLPGWQDPFAAATAVQTGSVPTEQVGPIIDWLSQMKVRSYVSDVWLKRVQNLSPNVFKLL